MYYFREFPHPILQNACHYIYTARLWRGYMHYTYQLYHVETVHYEMSNDNIHTVGTAMHSAHNVKMYVNWTESICSSQT